MQPAPAGLAIQLHALEDRILTRTDEIVGGFNQVLQVGLGEVQAKYKVSLAECLVDWDPENPADMITVTIKVAKILIVKFQVWESEVSVNAPRVF